MGLDGMSNGSQQIRRTYAAGALIGVVFLACSLLLLRQIGQQTERENALYLYDTINQLHALFQRQITMDFQILRGVAITLAHAPRDKVMPILKEVNDNNEFMRMGLASPDGLLELECAESLPLFDESFRELILALQEHGFRCSLDDFGAGFSSLNVLKELPIDVLKLDIPFLRNSRDQQRERIVISNILAMARELGIKTVAEGVEEPGQVDFLRAKGCDSVQGFVFARPMPAAEFSAMLAKLQGGPVPLTRP